MSYEMARLEVNIDVSCVRILPNDVESPVAAHMFAEGIE